MTSSFNIGVVIMENDSASVNGVQESNDGYGLGDQWKYVAHTNRSQFRRSLSKTGKDI